ncbi:hypothetical protein HRbin08_02044 [bacterium HR08]|nr:hypothetical protein HRbin08_02044 [bacterium HR08]
MIHPPLAHGDEPPELILDEGPADVAVQIVDVLDGITRLHVRALTQSCGHARQQFLPQLGTHVIGLQCIGRPEKENGAVNFVPAIFGHHVHVDAALRDLGGQRPHLVIDLFEHAGIVVDGRRASGAPRPIDLQAVNGEFLIAVARAMDRQRVLLHPFRPADIESARGDAGDHAREHPGVTGIGNALEDVLRDHRLRHDVARVDDGRFSADGDDLDHLAHVQLDIDRRLKGRGDDDPFSNEGLEAGMLEAERIFARLQIEEFVVAVLVGLHRAGAADERRSAHGDGDAGEDRSSSVPHGPGDRPHLDLGSDGDGDAEDQSDAGDDLTCITGSHAHGHPSSVWVRSGRAGRTAHRARSLLGRAPVVARPDDARAKASVATLQWPPAQGVAWPQRPCARRRPRASSRRR